MGSLVTESMQNFVCTWKAFFFTLKYIQVNIFRKFTRYFLNSQNNEFLSIKIKNNNHCIIKLQQPS